MIIPMLCVTIFVILVVWFLLPRVARLMIHTPTAISIFVCLSMVQLMAVFISMRCTLCGHFLQVALTLILVVEDDFDFLTSNKVWIATDRSRARRCVEACVYGTLDFVGYPSFPAPVEFIAAVIAYYVHPVIFQTDCLIIEISTLSLHDALPI